MASNSGAPEVLSPELVLIDPRLADEVRARTVSNDTARAQPEAPHGPSTATEVEAARRRLVELSVVKPPVPQRRLRATKLVGAMATWTAVALLAVYTQLYTLFR